MKKIFAIVVFFLTAIVSFAQSSDFIIHAVPIGKSADSSNMEEWADTYLTTNKQWVIAYEGVWVMLSKDGKTVTITDEKPEFTDAVEVNISSEEFIFYEEVQWNLPGEVQTKKFKYDYKDYKDLRYLVITVKKS